MLQSSKSGFARIVHRRRTGRQPQDRERNGLLAGEPERASERGGLAGMVDRDVQGELLVLVRESFSLPRLDDRERECTRRCAPEKDLPLER